MEIDAVWLFSHIVMGVAEERSVLEIRKMFQFGQVRLEEVYVL